MHLISLLTTKLGHKVTSFIHDGLIADCIEAELFKNGLLDPIEISNACSLLIYTAIMRLVLDAIG